MRFRSPVFAGETIDCIPVPSDNGEVLVEARAGHEERPRATVRAWTLDRRPVPSRPGERLPDYHLRLGGELGPDYGVRAGDDLEVCPLAGVVHPAVWPAVANNVFHQHLVRGPWVHTRSTVSHRGLVHGGAEIVVSTTVVERFHRSGERAIADVVIRADGAVVAHLEHEAIIDLSGAAR